MNAALQLLQPEPTPKLIPALSQQTAIERKLAGRILKLNPGIGEKSIELANSLCDSTLAPGMAAAIISAVYSPSDAGGRGQGTRIKWFVDAINQRYGSRLDKIKSSIPYFRTFIAEMEEMTDLRDTLNGEGYGASFQSTFLLWEVGLNSAEAMRILEALADCASYKSSALRILVKAAQIVKSGGTSSIEAAISELCHEYRG